MEEIKLNNWNVKGNEMSISLLHFYVNISLQKGDDIYFKLSIKDSNNKRLVLNFNTLEETIFFTENIINNCMNIDEITSI